MVPSTTTPRFDVRLNADDAGRETDELRAALTASPRRIPSRYFYDATGSALFEEITTLPEYYPTRAEELLLESHAVHLTAAARPRTLVELGSGAATKTRILLDAMVPRGLGCYAPFDVDETSVRRTAAELVARYPGLEVYGVVGDFMTDLEAIPPGEARLVAFLGSTIGNLDRAETVSFLSRVAAVMGAGDRFLLGVDLIKDGARLEAAYNDAAGTTARFNRNILKVVNRRYGGDFDPTAFAHRAFFNAAESRIEMWLVSRRPQRVRLTELELEIEIDAGEGLLTEISTKYSRERVDELLAAGGLQPQEWLEHPRGDFALTLARRAEP